MFRHASSVTSVVFIKLRLKINNIFFLFFSQISNPNNTQCSTWLRNLARFFQSFRFSNPSIEFKCAISSPSSRFADADSESNRAQSNNVFQLQLLAPAAAVNCRLPPQILHSQEAAGTLAPCRRGLPLLASLSLQ